MTTFKYGDKVFYRGDSKNVVTFVAYDLRFPATCVVETDKKELYLWDTMLLEKVPEPIKIKGYVNVNTNGHIHGGIHDTKKEADMNSNMYRIACIYITGEEGVEP